MSDKSGKQKNSTGTTHDFQAIVRELLVKLSEGQDRILHDTATLKAIVQLNEASLNNISGRLNHSKSSSTNWSDDSCPSSVIHMNVT